MGNTMIQATGYAALKPKSALAPFDFERRSPGDHDIVIDIHYCGICHSDIHQVGDEWGRSIFPMVPGHEIVGIVSQIGTKVTDYKVGDRVGVGCFVNSCRKCTSCDKGLEQYCLEGATLTYNDVEMDGKTPTYGGYSNKIVVDENYVLQIPENLPLDRAAPLLCAGITLYSPLVHWNAGPGKKVGIIGLGGLGHMGVKIAHAMGAHVVLFTTSPGKTADAKRLGAHEVVVSRDAAAMQKHAGSFDFILDTVSAVH